MLVVCELDQCTKRQNVRSGSLNLFTGKMIKPILLQLQAQGVKMQIQAITRIKYIFILND